MPTGVPKSGFRLTKKRKAIMSKNPSLFGSDIKLAMNKVQSPAPVKVETIDEIKQKLADRFEALEIMSDATGRGINRSLIVSGPAGLGKSFTVEERLAELEENEGINLTYIKGYIRPMALYRLLYNSRQSNCVLVFDDSDSLFYDDLSMNVLKAACDSTERRVLHWLSKSIENMTDEEGDQIPEKFEFEGSIIFITNYDFDEMINRGSKLAPHFQALVSRSHYLDLAMKTELDYVVRIKQVVGKGMLKKRGFSKAQEDEIVDFIEDNMYKLRELSLRMVVKLSQLYKMNNKTWKKLAFQTCFRAA